MARTVAAASHQCGLRVPGFRTAPVRAGSWRAIKRYANGSCLVSVVIQGRTEAAVLADMIDGVVAANQLAGAGAEDVRRRLMLQWRPASALAA